MKPSLRSPRPLGSAGYAALSFGAWIFLEHLCNPLPVRGTSLPVLGASALGVVLVFLPLWALCLLLSWGSERLKRHTASLWRAAILFAVAAFVAVSLFASLDPSLTILSSSFYLLMAAASLGAAALTWLLIRRRPPPTRSGAALLVLGVGGLLLWFASLLPPYNSQHQLFNALLVSFLLVSLGLGLLSPRRQAPALFGLSMALLGAVLFVGRYREDFIFRNGAARGGRLSRTFLRHLTPLLLPSEGLQYLKQRAAPAPLSRLSALSAPTRDLLDALRDARPANVVWVTIDTLRADLGGALPASFERLNRESVRFTSFYSTATSTRAALQGLFLGWEEWMREPPSRHLFARFQQHGFRTIGLLSTDLPIADSWTSRGFDVLRYPASGQGSISALEVNALFAAELKNRPQGPFLAWLHYIEPHAPYEGQGTPRERYVMEVNQVAQALADLLRNLEQDGLLENTLLLVTADHGEEFGEHGGTFHSRAMFNETIQVPLWLRAPGGAISGEISTPFSAASLSRLVLSLVGISEDGAPSTSLPLLDEAPVFSFMAPYAKNSLQRGSSSVIYGHYKLIYNLQMKNAALFDLQTDPLERENLIEAHPDIAATLAALLSQEFQRHGLNVN